MCFLDQYPDEQYLIRFNKVNSKGICGVADDGHQVYMDSYSGIKPQLGDAWYCNLITKYTADNYFYIANPVYKVEDRNVPLVDLSEPRAATEASESQEQFVPELSGFVAIGDDTIYSPKLTATRYTVYRSFNGEHFEIIPDPNGDIPCIRSSIALESFDNILDCEFPVRLDCVMKDDKILLNLTQ